MTALARVADRLLFSASRLPTSSWKLRNRKASCSVPSVSHEVGKQRNRLFFGSGTRPPLLREGPGSPLQPSLPILPFPARHRGGAMTWLRVLLPGKFSGPRPQHVLYIPLAAWTYHSAPQGGFETRFEMVLTVVSRIAGSSDWFWGGKICLKFTKTVTIVNCHGDNFQLQLQEQLVREAF